SRRRHTRFSRDWSSDVCSSDLNELFQEAGKVRIQGFEAGLGANLLSATKHQLRLSVNATILSSEVLEGALVDKDMFDGVVHNSRSEERRVGKECRYLS